MSMNPESEDFQQLRRLFALKRHEQPPPGYFNNFPRDVVARIKEGDQGEASESGNWFQRLWTLLEAKPIFAGAFGASFCALLISGILNSEEGAASASALNPILPHANGAFPAAVTLNEPMSDSVLNTNPIASLDSLFNFHLMAQPQNVNVSYNLPDGN